MSYQKSTLRVEKSHCRNRKSKWIIETYLNGQHHRTERVNLCRNKINDKIGISERNPNRNSKADWEMRIDNSRQIWQLEEINLKEWKHKIFQDRVKQYKQIRTFQNNKLRLADEKSRKLHTVLHPIDNIDYVTRKEGREESPAVKIALMHQYKQRKMNYSSQ